METTNFKVRTTLGNRSENIERLAREDFDFLIIGGGITGAGIARDAALRGFKVALIDANDFSYGTSSRSSKLVHGGVRYLENYQFKMVFESCQERYTLAKLAPNIVKPLKFFMPVYQGDPHRTYKIDLGLWLYDILSTFKNYKRHKRISLKKLDTVSPPLTPENLQGLLSYYDFFSYDSRLTLLNLKQSAVFSAVLANYAKLESFNNKDGKINSANCTDKITGKEFTIKAQVFINASGPWVEQVSRFDDPKIESFIRPTKGSHIILYKKGVNFENAVTMRAKSDKRVCFIIPWGEHIIAGTTDLDYKDDLDDINIDSAETDYILETVNYYLDGIEFTRDDIVSTYSGVRPLIDGKSNKHESEVSREHKVIMSDSGLVTIAGGKLTTYRSMSNAVLEEILKRYKSEIPLRPFTGCITDKVHLFKTDEDIEKSLAALNLVKGKTINFLSESYGQELVTILNILNKDNNFAEKISKNLLHIKAEIPFAIENEMTVSLTDFMKRRSQIFYKDLNQGLDIAKEVATEMAKYLGWNETEITSQVESYKKEVDKSRQYRY